jgi:xylitol oxidase
LHRADGCAGSTVLAAATFQDRIYAEPRKELQSEYFVPRRNAVDASLAVERLREQAAPHLFITEIRVIAEDHLCMSPYYKQARVTIHFTWKPDWPAVSQLLPFLEKELGPFHPWPHSGKLSAIFPVQLHACYEKRLDFAALSRQFDPQYEFNSAFLDANIFGSNA